MVRGMQRSRMGISRSRSGFSREYQSGTRSFSCTLFTPPLSQRHMDKLSGYEFFSALTELAHIGAWGRS